MTCRNLPSPSLIQQKMPWKVIRKGLTKAKNLWRVFSRTDLIWLQNSPMCRLNHIFQQDRQPLEAAPPGLTEAECARAKTAAEAMQIETSDTAGDILKADPCVLISFVHSQKSYCISCRPNLESGRPWKMQSLKRRNANGTKDENKKRRTHTLMRKKRWRIKDTSS